MNIGEEREQLILEHYGLVIQIARRMHSRYPRCVELDDLISIGTVGLIDAADRFDISLNIAFGSYARIRIQGSIVDALRKQDWVPRLVRSRNRTYGAVLRNLEARLCRLPSLEEMAEFLSGLGVGDFHAFRSEAHVSLLISAEDERPEGPFRIGDSLVSPGALPDEICAIRDIKKHITEVILGLSEREQFIVQLYYFESHSLRAVGEVLGISESRVCQLHGRIRKKIKDELLARKIEQAA